MKTNSMTLCALIAGLATVGLVAQDDCRWDINVMGLVKVGKNKKGEGCINIGFGLAKKTGDKVSILYGLMKSDQEKVSIFGKVIEPNINVSNISYDGSTHSTINNSNSMTISYSDCRHGCVNGISCDTVKKEYVLKRKKKEFNIMHPGILYILECDKVLQDAINDGLMLSVENNKVKYYAPRNTSMRFSKTGGQPLCTFLGMQV